MALFVKKGVTETTIRDIAQEAGVAEGALYRHYPSKDELINALFERHYADFARRLTSAQALPQTTRGKLEAMIEECCHVFDEERDLFSFLLLTQHHSRNSNPWITPTDVVRDVLKTGMKKGDIPVGDVDLATALVMGIIVQPATFKTYGRLPGPMRPLASALTDACWRVLRVDRAPFDGRAPRASSG